MARTGGDVIGIEQECKSGIVRTIGRGVRRQDELLEEPGGMGAMPFDRAGVRHRLYELVLRRQRRGAPLGFRPHRPICVKPCAPWLRRRGPPLTTTKSAAVVELHR